MLLFRQSYGFWTDGILHSIIEFSDRSLVCPSMSDERQLLKSLRQLEPEAITEIHNRFFPDVFRYARYRLGDFFTAEDIASETFIRLIDALHKGKGPRKSLRGWLIGTTSNLINDHFRRSYAQPFDDIRDSLEIENPGGNPALSYEQSDQVRMIRKALQALPKTQQHVLALRFGSGYSLAETAEIMNKKTNAIKQLQFRALTALRQELGGYLDE